jgi:RNA polymerase sigma factor for flagellar operon FliA
VNVSWAIVLSAENHKLVETHLGLARAIAAKVHRIMRGSVDYDELLAQALAGLSEAAGRYDPEAATPFGLFAQYRIRGAIFDWLRSMGYLQRRRRELPAVATAATATGGGLAGSGPASGRSGPAAAVRTAAVSPTDLRGPVTYLAVGEDDDRDGALSVLSPDPLADAVLAEKHTRLLLAGVLHRLPARERSFLHKHYFEDKTMAEAGAELGLSRYQSCRLHARAVARLRENLAAEGFERADDV